MRLLPLIVLFALLSPRSFAQDQRLVDSLQAKLAKSAHDSTRADLLFQISKCYWDNEPDKALSYANQCLSYAEKIGYKRGIGRAFQSLASVTYSKGDYYRALELVAASMSIRTEIKDTLGIASCYNLYAMIYQKQNRWPEALSNNLSSLTLSEAIGDKNGMANSLIGIGLVHISQQNRSTALQSFQSALALKQEVGEKVGVQTCYNNIANVYQADGNYDEALKNFKISLDVALSIGNRLGIANAYNNIGVVYFARGDYEEALKYVLRAKSIRDELGDKSAIINSYINLGEIFLAQKKYKEADENNYSAIALAKEIGKLAGLLNGYQGLARSDSAPGKYREALEHYKSFTIYRDSLRNSDNIRKVVSMQMNYQFGKKQDSLKAIQDKKDALAAAALEQQRLSALLREKQYDDSLAKKENEKKLAALQLQYGFDRTRDSIQANQLQKDAVADKELQKQKLMRNGFIGGFAFVLLVAALLVQQRRKIREGKKQSDNLLLNILPVEVADELKKKGHAEAKQFDNVSVLFTDFASFTSMSERLTAQELVNELHACFTRFDEICEKYDIEKVKTIGDAYLAVCGLPVPVSDHAVRVVRAAIEIRDFMLMRKAELGDRTFAIRIGINSGSVVAGIVGVKKYSYDIWGDTVNTAARMEQNSEVGKINISESTYELVKETVVCEYRGEIDAKNKGKLKMYFVGEEKTRP